MTETPNPYRWHPQEAVFQRFNEETGNDEYQFPCCGHEVRIPQRYYTLQPYQHHADGCQPLPQK
jgi:hypothetical protein